MTDLPPLHPGRWTARRKAAIVGAVIAGEITAASARAWYDLSDEELAEWMRAYMEHGEKALKTTHLRRYRSRP